jgi:excisionase family DNA binding protein
MAKKHDTPVVSSPTLSTTTETKQTIRAVAIAAAALRTPEAAAYLNVQPATLEQWRWNGRGPRFVKIGRSVRYRHADLDEFLGSRVFSNTTEAQAA